MFAHAESEETSTAHGGFRSPKVSEPAYENDVMREQLEYLIRHTAGAGICGCSECRRYLRARTVLLEIFREPEPRQATQLTGTLPMAA